MPDDIFDYACKKYAQAKVELEEALRKRVKDGFYPSPPENIRFRLPDEREGATHKFIINSPDGEFEGYITLGQYSDGHLGEIFLVSSKEGTFVSGLLDAFATLFSVALQSGVPLSMLVTKFKGSRFEPSGMTKNPHIRTTSSVLDYIMKWLEMRYLGVSHESRTR